MIKVTALSGRRYDPASRFRIRQFIRPLAQFGIDVSEHYLPITRYRRQPLATLAMLWRLPGIAASRHTDITWFGRELIPERFTLERFAGGRRIFDVDDAIWLLSPSDFSERIVALCDGVIAGNHWLAKHYEELGKPVWIVPTSVDTEAWKPLASGPRDSWIVGWMGTNSNLRFLAAIEEPLAQFLAEHGDAHLRIVCDRRPAFKLIPQQSWEFIKWSPKHEVESMQTMNVGLMPLEDSEWARGHLPGAVHLSKGVIERDIEQAFPDRATPLVLYCGGGFRSALAADSLQKMGYTNVLSMDGGWRGWNEAGYPIAKD